MARYAAELRQKQAFRTAQSQWEGAPPDDDFDEFYDPEEVAQSNDEERIARAADSAASKEYA